MNQMIIRHPRPNCDICGKEMQEWTAFATTHHHNECLSEKLASEMIDFIKEEFKKLD